jgi:hypothetical protein
MKIRCGWQWSCCALLLIACDGTPAGTDGGVDGSSSRVDSGPPDAGVPICQPDSPACQAAPACLGLVDNEGPAPDGLRIGQLDLTDPTAFTRGIVRNVVVDSVLLPLPDCNLGGSGTLNWLLQLSGDQLRVGSARPVSDPRAGYDFNTDPASVQVDAPVGADGSFSTATPIDRFVLPIYGDAAGTMELLRLPLRQLSIEGTLSADRSCIGTYNAANLDPENSCLADDLTPTFLTGGSVRAYITLEDADSVIIDSLGQSLCVLLSRDATTYGDGGSPNRCRREGGVITFRGDWCSVTDLNAAGDCADAVRFQGSFAASSVAIRG